MGGRVQGFGRASVLVLDGDYVERAQLRVPVEMFGATDLSRPFRLGRGFDLVISLEVGEHLPPEVASDFVGSLVAHSDMVMFSAAIPRHGGVHHVNEQWPSYWRQLFAEHEYQLFDVIRPRIWSDRRVAFWYRQNMLLFAGPGCRQAGGSRTSGRGSGGRRAPR